MVLRCPRPAPQWRLPAWVGVLTAVGTLLLGPHRATAGENDINLLNLCESHTPPGGTLGALVPECSWLKREAATGLIQSVTPDPDAESRFRSLMSELGVIMAPRLVMPADTLGFSGFQVSGEVGTTTISNKEPYWNGVDGVSPQNPTARRPSGRLTTVGAFVRKGLWFPVPAFELGAGVMHLTDSQLLSWQGYGKMAIHEGFHGWPVPSFAVRGSFAHLTGSDQIRMTVAGLDLILSKAFSFFKTARLEPFGGWSLLFINAKASAIDTTPSCDAYAVRTALANQSLGDYCAEAQRGTSNDTLANFAFPDQDVIARHRFFVGAKLKFALVFVSAQYEIVPVGRSRDERRANGARDGSGKQESFSLSLGFDY